MRSSNARNVDAAAPLLANLNVASRRLYEDLAITLPGDIELVKRGLLMLCRTDAEFEAESAHAGQTVSGSRPRSCPLLG
jgi:D-amino-acid dehydrogenase